jgi:hypothetical protein
MWTPRHPLKGGEKILISLAEFDYLTASQLTRLLHAPSSHAYVRKQLHFLADSGFVLPFVGRSVTMPRVYTLTEAGYTYTTALGMPHAKRVRPTEEREKAHNLYFIQHTIAVTDVLIGARLLSQTVPGIRLTRMYTERELKRKIYVALPEHTWEGTTQQRRICLEPDASVQFTSAETWEDFFHLEIYRTHLSERRFKQKIAGYVAYIGSTKQQELFHTPVLSIAVFAASPQLARALQQWTEEVLQEMQLPELGERFFFRSIADTATTTPVEMYLSPVWQQAFGEARTPPLALDEENGA